MVISKILQILDLSALNFKSFSQLARTSFSHSRSEQFWKQNNISKIFYFDFHQVSTSIHLCLQIEQCPFDASLLIWLYTLKFKWIINPSQYIIDIFNIKSVKEHSLKQGILDTHLF